MSVERIGPWVAARKLPDISGRRTSMWEVCSRGKAGALGGVLGRVKWWSPWRCYAFFPEPAVFEATCLKDIAAFLTKETTGQRRKP